MNEPTSHRDAVVPAEVPVDSSSIAATEADSHGFSRVLKHVDVFLLCLVATVNLNLIPELASHGVTMYAFLAVVVLTFVIPQGLAVTELRREFPGEGGMAEWVRAYFGDYLGFVTAWFYWANNIVYVPALLVFVVGNLAFLAGYETSAEGHDLLVLGGSIVGLWLVVALSIIGFGSSRWISNAGGIGTLIALVVLAIVCAMSLFGGHTSGPTDWTLKLGWESWAVYGVLCIGLIGPELATVVGDEIKTGEASGPGAIWRVSALSVGCYVIGTGALIFSLPAGGTHGADDLLKVVEPLVSRVGVGWTMIPFGLLLVTSVAGAAVSWYAGASRMLWVAAHDGALPERFADLHPRFGTPAFSILVQGLLSTVVLVGACLVGERPDESLLGLTIALQLVPYLLMFAGLAKSGRTRSIPRPGFVLAGLAGVASTVVGIFFAFVPPSNGESFWVYQFTQAVGVSFFLGTGTWAFRRQQKIRAATETQLRPATH